MSVGSQSVETLKAASARQVRTQQAEDRRLDAKKLSSKTKYGGSTWGRGKGSEIQGHLQASLTLAQVIGDFLSQK